VSPLSTISSCSFLLRILETRLAGSEKLQRLSPPGPEETEERD